MPSDRFDRFTENLTPERPHLPAREAAILRHDMIAAFRTLAQERSFDVLSLFGMDKIASKLRSYGASLRDVRQMTNLLRACVSGSVSLKLMRSDEDVPIAGPNGGGYEKFVTVKVVDAYGKEVGVLSGLSVTVTPGHTGADFGDPAINDGAEGDAVTVALNEKAAAAFTIKYADGTYAADDTVTATVSLTVCGIVLTPVVYTDTMVA